MKEVQSLILRIFISEDAMFRYLFISEEGGAGM
jgi:hypothetical protein